MKGIKINLWYDKEGAEAAQTYVRAFRDARINSTRVMHDTPSGDAQTVDFSLPNLDLIALSAGPYFKFNPAASLFISCRTKEEVDALYRHLMEGGRELMPLGTYDFSPWFAWVEDKYGLSWQIILAENKQSPLDVRPALLFSGDATGRAEEALNFYLSVFPDSKIGEKAYFEKGSVPDERANLMYADITIHGKPLIIQDNGMPVDYTFNEAFSLMVLCDDQEEIDRLWQRLSHVPESEQCGWLKDKFGVSWQIVPHNLDDILFTGTQEETARWMKVFLDMKKIDIAALEKAKKG